MRINFGRRIVAVASTALAVCAICSVAEARTWTDVKGRKVEAELIEVDMEKGVLVRLESGKEVWIGMDKLAVRDRMFARQEFARQSAADPYADPETSAEAKEDKPAKPEPEPSVEPNFTKPWPSVINAGTSPKLVFSEKELGEKAKLFVCESDHYRVSTTARLSKSLTKRLMVLLEATHRYCASVPLNFVKPRVKSAEKFSVRLFADKGEYRRAGGVTGSGACYDSASGAVLITLEAFGVKSVGNGFTGDSSGRDMDLVGLYVRQLADPAWSKIPWLDRGLASFMRITPYRPGKFSSSAMKRPVVRFVMNPIPKEENQEYLLDPDYEKSKMQKLLEEADLEDTIIEKPFEPGFGLGNKVVSPPLARLMAYSEMEFDADLLGEQERSAVHYGVATLLVQYLLNGEGAEGQKAFKKYLYALQQGKPGSEALKELYGDRTPDEFQQTFARYCRRAGIAITFE